ncbi:glutamate--cysteine ligase [Klebsiella pneumoniae subsp. rhinoscleromatis]|nr:glutamate--cysteine ligase [Klebsiella pneumoniae subsp. rhinoscleromatis]
MSCCAPAPTGIGVILEGRKPGLTLGIGCESAQFPLAQVGKDLFRDLRPRGADPGQYPRWPGISAGLRRAAACFDDPELTFSARILRSMIEEGIGGTGRALADRYRTQLREEPLEILSEDDFIAERDASGGATEESGS